MSNEEVSQEIASAVENMKNDVKKEVTAVYAKIQTETHQSLKNYNDSLKAIERQTMQFWTFKGVKEALFWAMCSAVIVMSANKTFDMLGIELDMLWVVLYPLTIVFPLFIYGLEVYARKHKK